MFVVIVVHFCAPCSFTALTKATNMNGHCSGRQKEQRYNTDAKKEKYIKERKKYEKYLKTKSTGAFLYIVFLKPDSRGYTKMSFVEFFHIIIDVVVVVVQQSYLLNPRNALF